MKTDHWFYGLLQGAPDLVTLLLPGVPAARLGAEASGDRDYRFEAPELKAVNHRLDGVLWPRESAGGTEQRPVVLLEVQMHSKPGFQHRLAAQSYRFLQQHPQVEHLAVLVVVPHRRLRLGPLRPPRHLQLFLDAVEWLSLEDLGRQPNLDPLLTLLTLPVRPAAELADSTRQLLERRPDLLSAVLPILMERFPTLPHEEIMLIAGISSQNLRHTRAAQDWIEEGRQEGRQEGQAQVALRLLNRRCGPLSDATTARIQALPPERLEALVDALLEFSGPAHLAAWLAEQAG